MEIAWFIGCILTGALLVTLAAVGAASVWDKNADLEVGFVLIFLCTPIVGWIVGGIGGGLFAWMLPHLAPRAGWIFLLLAIPPLWVSGFFFVTGTWQQFFDSHLAAIFLLSPPVVGLGLIGCGGAHLAQW